MSSQEIREILQEHYHSPKNMSVPNIYSQKATAVNRSCGDEITAYIIVKEGKISQINFTAEACAISIASCSILSEELKGMEVSKVLEIDSHKLKGIIGFDPTPNRLRCALIALEAIQSATLAVKSID